jgi:hypothetical protein
LGAAALYGSITYHIWLLLLVAMNALLYLLEAVASCLFARHAEASWRATPRH